MRIESRNLGDLAFQRTQSFFINIPTLQDAEYCLRTESSASQLPEDPCSHLLILGLHHALAPQIFACLSFFAHTLESRVYSLFDHITVHALHFQIPQHDPPRNLWRSLSFFAHTLKSRVYSLFDHITVHALHFQIRHHAPAPKLLVVAAQRGEISSVLRIVEIAAILKPPNHQLDQRFPIFRLGVLDRKSTRLNSSHLG